MARTEVNLAEQVLGVLPVANGGTGAGTLTGLVVGNGTSTFTTLAINQASIPENVTTSSAASLTLSNTVSNYVFTGSSGTTWTLPTVSGNTGVRFWIENRGSAAITLNPAGSDHIWFKASVGSMTIAAGGSLELINDGTYWNALSIDLVNNTVGTLPVGNGGTGAALSMTTNQFIISNGSTSMGTLNMPLPTTNGGTGSSAGLTGLVVGNGASAMTAVTAPAGTVVGTTDTQTLSGKTLTTPTVNGYTETVQALGTVTTSKTIPALSGGTMMTCLLTAADTCVFTMPTATAGQSFTLAVQQASTPTGNATFTSVIWPGGSAPTVTTTASYYDLFSFFCFDGSHWRGTAIQSFSA